MASTKSKWYEETATAHALADYACGRDWECACGPCRVARREGWKPPRRPSPADTAIGAISGVVFAVYAWYLLASMVGPFLK